MVRKDKKYECKNCGLHYDDRKKAEECNKWCDEHGTCNIDLTKDSIEVKGGKNNENKDKN